MQIFGQHSNTMFDLSLQKQTQIERINAAQNISNKEKIAEAAEDFEAFFISRAMESMFEGVSTDGMFGGGHAEKVYRSLLFTEYGKVMAKTGSIGVKDEIMRSILEMQERESGASV